MKNTIKWFGFIVLVAVIGFSMTACDDGNSPTSTSLDGTWERNTTSGTGSGMRVTVSGSTAILNHLNNNPNALTKDAIDKGYLKVGNQYWQELTSAGNLTWSGQQSNISYYTSSPNVAIGLTWVDCTFTMSSDGKTLTVRGSGSGGWTQTWTRK